MRRVLDLELVPGLRSAVEAGELQLLYQPQIDLAGGEVTAVEALLRWHHPERGVLRPGEFLDAAEGAGLLDPIADWALAAAVRAAARWQELLGGERRVWANLSSGQLARPGFADAVEALLLTAGVTADHLGVEVSARTLAGAGRPERAVVGDLVALGVAVGLDDVRGDAEDLARLAHLPVEAVKLDPSLVRGLDGDDDRVVPAITAVVGRAHEHGCYVVAESVESWTEGARLMELGCDRAHGYLFSAPQRPQTMRWMLASGPRGWRAAVRREATGPELS